MPDKDQPGERHADHIADGQEPRPARGQNAMERVLSSPDLVQHILAQMPTPYLHFACEDPRKVMVRDRWDAGQVNRLWRKTALRLPWDVDWDFRENSGKGGPADIHVLRTPRNVQHMNIWGLCQDKLEQCASLVGCASSLSSLRVECETEDTLLQWLRHPQVPFARNAALTQGLPGNPPVLAGLSSLAHLDLKMHSLTDASWLTALQRVESVELSGYRGPPLAGLPHLQTLWVKPGAKWVQLIALEQWASPRLTALTFGYYYVYPIGPPWSSHPVQEPHAESQVPRMWLRALKRLGLMNCRMNQQGPGLRELVPNLTFLELDLTEPAHSTDFSAVLAKGLPLQLQGLHVRYYNLSIPGGLWSAISTLASLEMVGIEQTELEVPLNDFEVAARSLAALPRLQEVNLNFAVEDAAGLGQCVEGLKAQLRARGGKLRVGLPHMRLWDSSPVSELSLPELDSEDSCGVVE